MIQPLDYLVIVGLCLICLALPCLILLFRLCKPAAPTHIIDPELEAVYGRILDELVKSNKG
jgi:hypothetical protein